MKLIDFFARPLLILGLMLLISQAVESRPGPEKDDAGETNNFGPMIHLKNAEDNSGKNRRSQPVFANNFGGAKFDGSGHNFGTQNFIENQEQASNNIGFPVILETQVRDQQQETISEQVKPEKSENENVNSEKEENDHQETAVTEVKDLERQKRQHFANDFSHANIAGGEHNFGQKNYAKYYEGHGYEGGSHNFGHVNRYPGRGKRSTTFAHNFSDAKIDGGKHNFGQKNYGRYFEGNGYEGGKHNFGEINHGYRQQVRGGHRGSSFVQHQNNRFGY